jgi:hypothetical protein
MIVLDGTWCEKGGELAWEGLWHLRTSDVGEVLEGMVRRMEKPIAVDMDPLSLLCRLATSVPPPRLHTIR